MLSPKKTTRSPSRRPKVSAANSRAEGARSAASTQDLRIIRFNDDIMVCAMKTLLLLVPLAAFGVDTWWPVNGGPGNIRYTELPQITPANVAQLQVAWSWDAREAFKD